MIILFCEECGHKNSVDESLILDSKIKFRCQACEYLNTKIIQPRKKHPDSMIELFNVLGAMPDVNGLYLYHRQQGILMKKMPHFLKESDLQLLGKTLADSYQAGHSRYSDINLMTLIIKGNNIIARMLNPHTAIIVACRTYPIPTAVENWISSHNLNELFARGVQ